MPTTSSIIWRFPTQIYIWVTVMQGVVDGSTNKYFQFNSATSGLDDLVCTATEILQSTTSFSDLHCSHICARDILCQGFFYHQGDGLCITTNKYFVEIDVLSTYAGMTYYRGPLWKEWGSWSDCSATCGTGSSTRTRTCHPDSPVPCNQDTEDTKTCNTYGCTPYARTCAEWASRGLNQSTTVQIDPKEIGTTKTVSCDFDTEPGKAITILNHNRETRTYVSGYENPGSYSISLVYDIGIDLASEVADHSTECKQYLKYECHHAYLSDYVSWKTRSGTQALYFNGSPPPGKRCACGDTNSCATGVTCNCDQNDATLRSDVGYVTDKSELPISGFDAGDTGSAIEYAYHTIGPLLCS